MKQHDMQITSLCTIRDFLRQERREPPPWAPPARAVDELYELLRQRKGDDLFWLRLKDLAVRLEDQHFSSATLARSDALGGATVDRLLEDLRASLDGSARRNGTLRDWLASAISASALMGFLLLGTATGCADDDARGDDFGSDSDTDSDTDGDTDTDQSCAEADNEGFTGEEAEIYCDLIDIVEGASVSEAVKQQILECLPDLDAANRELLLEQFQSMTAEDLAAYLQEMISLGGECYEADTDDGTH